MQYVHLLHFECFLLIALQTWFDESMTWDPNKYENTTRLVVSSMKLWLPDMFVFNTYGFASFNSFAPKLMIKIFACCFQSYIFFIFIQLLH